MRGSQIAVNVLESLGITKVFGLIGAGNIDLLDALSYSGIGYISTRHEQVAVTMAEGYAYVTDSVGLATVTNGPGIVSCTLGLSLAMSNSVPLLLISGQIPEKDLRKGYGQELNAMEFLKEVTKARFKVSRASEIPEVLVAAYREAINPIPGPVYVEIPNDVQAEEVEISEEILAGVHPPTIIPVAAERRLIEKAATWIREAETPIMWVGYGVGMSGAAPAVVKLAETLECPVVTPYGAKGAFPEDHRLSAGLIGFYIDEDRSRLLKESDLIITLGSSLNPFSSELGVPPDYERQRVIRVDVDPRHLTFHHRNHLPILGDARLFCEAMLNTGEIFTSKHGQGRMTPGDTPILDIEDSKVAVMFKTLCDTLPRETIYVIDSGKQARSIARHLKIKGPRKFLTTGKLGSIAYGLSAALGAKVGCPDLAVVCLSGDGGLMHIIQEIETGVREDIPVVLVVLNDNAYGVIKWQQEQRFNGRYIGTDIAKNDYVMVAKGFGAEGYRTEDPEEVISLVRSAIKENKFTLIDFAIS